MNETLHRLATLGLVASALQTPASLALSDYPVLSGLKRIPGVVEGYQGLRGRDDILVGSLVLPTLRPQELLQFQFETLLAPQEQLKAGPLSLDVPGNLHIPAQKERYGILPITIAKEQFGFYSQPGRSEELMAITFSTKFSDLVKMGQNKAPFTEMIPLISLTQYTITPNRDWSGQNGVRLNLAHAYRRALGYRWTRGVAQQGSSDAIVAFQQTPAKRWMVTDIQGRVPAGGQIAVAPSLGNSPTRVLFMRIKNGPGQKIKSAEGHVVQSQGQAYSVQGVPEPVRGASVSGRTVRWTPISSPGWLALIRTVKGTAFSPVPIFPRLKKGLMGGFGSDEGNMLMSTQKLEGWFNAANGSALLSSPLTQLEELLVLFVGTSREVPVPTAHVEEPALFTYATDIRFVTLP